MDNSSIIGPSQGTYPGPGVRRKGSLCMDGVHGPGGW